MIRKFASKPNVRKMTEEERRRALRARRAAAERLRRRNEDFTIGWDDLMGDCIDIWDARDAKAYFNDVSSLAKRLDLVLSDGSTFSASDGLDAWDSAEYALQNILDSIDEDDDDLPNVGLKYFTYDDTLAVGIYDRGNFDAVAEWTFKPAQSLAMSHEARRPLPRRSIRKTTLSR